jgi:5-formyltetrahydrofolate cyclo-ligase
VRAQRRNLDAASRARWDQLINSETLKLVEQECAGSLAAYLPFDGEPDLRPALDILARRGVRIALPLVTKEPAPGHLVFRAWTPANPLATGPFGIDQPVGGEGVSPQELELLLMPLVAWDEQGHRLGMGAGYYDRALAACADSAYPKRIGIAYALQKHPGLPADPWDVGLHEVITECGRFTCRA